MLSCQGMAFIKKIETFICAKCGIEVVNPGYLNHCPQCLWSKHVDVDPGDRAADCGGLMEPIDLYFKGGKWIIVHRCQSCGYKSINKIKEEDDFDEVVALERKIVEKKMKKIN